MITDGLPNSIFFIGAEGAGNPAGGCLGPDMYVYPSGNAPDPCETFPIAVDAGNDDTVYYGWAPEECAYLCATISGSPSYPLTYSWSNGNTGQSFDVCPTTTTTYTVTVTDNNGCTATDEVIVNVVDVRCGKKNNKVLLCKPNGTTTVCVKKSNVQQKLNNGFSLGPCAANISKNLSISARTIDEDKTLIVYPTLFSDNLVIQLNSDYAESVQIDLFDSMGKIVRKIYKGSIGVRTMEIQTHDLADQIYIVRAIIDSEDVFTKKVIKRD